MGRIAVVTTFSPHGYEIYGRHMMRSFRKFWPEDVDLYAYHEGVIPMDAMPRANWFDLNRDQDRAKFMASHKDADKAEFFTKNSIREYPRFYTQMQPVKFSHKVFALTSAPRTADWLIWMDADIETKALVTHDFLRTITPDHVVASYLGRKWWSHSETGFMAFRLDEHGRQFLDDLRNVYVCDTIMELPSKIDSCAFDHVRAAYESDRHQFLDLGTDHHGPGLDVMAESVLASYLWHNKGDARKIKAYGAVA